MTNSQIFTKAHALTRTTIQTGDSYSATFALCLKAVYAEARQPKQTLIEIFAAKHRGMYGNGFELKRETEKAICVEMIGTLAAFDQWLPKSQIEIERTDEQDWVFVAMPQWLARKSGAENIVKF